MDNTHRRRLIQNKIKIELDIEKRISSILKLYRDEYCNSFDSGYVTTDKALDSTEVWIKAEGLYSLPYVFNIKVNNGSAIDSNLYQTTIIGHDNSEINSTTINVGAQSTKIYDFNTGYITNTNTLKKFLKLGIGNVTPGYVKLTNYYNGTSSPYCGPFNNNVNSDSTAIGNMVSLSNAPDWDTTDQQLSYTAIIDSRWALYYSSVATKSTTGNKYYSTDKVLLTNRSPFIPSDPFAKYLIRFANPFTFNSNADLALVMTVYFEMFDKIELICEDAYNELNNINPVYIGEYEFVDMELPSGTKWMKWAFGMPTEFVYSPSLLLKYDLTKTAAASIGVSMPTNELFKELFENTHVYRKDNDTYVLISKKNPKKYIYWSNHLSASMTLFYDRSFSASRNVFQETGYMEEVDYGNLYCMPKFVLN